MDLADARRLKELETILAESLLKNRVLEAVNAKKMVGSDLNSATPFDTIALFKNGGGGGNRTDLPSASDNAPALQVHCATVRSKPPPNSTIAGGLQGDCTYMQKDNAISMPNDLAAVVAIWPKLSDDQKTQVLAIVKARIA
jgi:hypothetical protein